jgi:hypothetical protein
VADLGINYQQNSPELAIYILARKEYFLSRGKEFQGKL